MATVPLADGAGRRAPWELPALLALALLAGAIVWFGTPWGLGLSPDSVGYLTAAQSLLEHGDPTRLRTHWPPGYPMLLAATAWIAADLEAGARLLQALTFAANALLLVVLARRATGHAALAFVLGSALLLQPALLQPHLVMWSEPAFLALCLADLLLLLHATSRRPSAGQVVAVACVAGAALLVRYAGAYLLLFNLVAWVLLSAPDARRRGLLAGLSAGVLGALPLLAWLAWRTTVAGPAPVRTLVWHPAGLGELRAAGATLADWASLPNPFAWPALGLLLALCLHAWHWRQAASLQGRLSRLLAIGALTYLAFLLLAKSLFDANIPFDGRVLLPLLPGFALMVAAAWPVMATRPVTLLPLGALIAVLGLGAVGGVRLWLHSHHDGLGLASRPLQQLPVWRMLSDAPPAWRLASNGPELIEIHLDRPAEMLPRGIELKTQLRNTDFGRQMDDMAARVDAIVVFQAMRFRGYLPPPEVIDRLAGFHRSYEGADAIVWMRKPASNKPP